MSHVHIMHWFPTKTHWKSTMISKEWVKFVNNTRKDFTFLARSRPLICSAHFSEDCRERSSALKESLGLKYRLKPGSIPTLKAPNIESTRASASTTALIITCVGTSRSCRIFPHDFINFVIIYLFIIYYLSFCRLYPFIRICNFVLSNPCIYFLICT